jgi:hypothetical protein
MSWPRGQDSRLRSECHRRRYLRHEAGGVGYWFCLRGRCGAPTGVTPPAWWSRPYLLNARARPFASRAVPTKEREAPENP